MIYYDPPAIELQNFLCLDVGTKKTGLAHNFHSNSIGFSYKTVLTYEVKNEILLLRKHFFQKIIVGLPIAYPESESYKFIVRFTNILQEDFPDVDLIFWDESDSSNTIRSAYKHGRKGFSKKFHQNYDKQSACLILNDFIFCNF